jgi:hypothetical protein
VAVMEGESGTDSDVKALVCVKEDLPDATGTDRADDGLGHEQLTYVTLKQEDPVSVLLHVSRRVGFCVVVWFTYGR